MEQTKEYFAFISYKREDEKWAKWLQHKLEHYRLPVNVRKENPSLPQSIRPVFKDTSELAAGVLADEIHEALDNSKYLIVICSPRAAQSEWVGKEVQTFIDMGRSDKIIPFIIGGTPFSDNPEEECFPSALLNLPKEQELLGVNINEMGREAAVVKVVARMFGLKFDTLWQRYEREQKRKRWMWIGGSILLALFGLSIGGYFVRQNGIIERQNERLQQDSVTMAEHITRIQNDSIKLSIQNDSIQKTNTLLTTANNNLAKANSDLREANFRIIQERNGMLAAQSRAVAEKAKELIDEGNTTLACRLLLEVLPDTSRNNCRPYVYEAEYELRRVLDRMMFDDYYSCFPVKSIWGKDVVAASFTKNGNEVVTTSGDGYLSFWNTITGRIVDSLETDVSNFAFNAQGSKLTIVGDKNLYIYDGNTHKLLNTLSQNSKIILSEFSPNGNILVTKHTDELKVFDLSNEKYLFSIPEKYDKHSGGVDEIAISPNNRLIALSRWSQNNGQFSYYIDCWDIQTGERFINKDVDKWVRSIIFTPNSKYILFAYALYGKDEKGYDIIYDLNIQDGSVNEGFKGISYGTGMMNFNNNGSWLSTISVENGTFRLWNLKSKSLLVSIDEAYQHYRPVVSNDNKCFISKSQLWRFGDKESRRKIKLSYPGFKYCKDENYVFINENDSCYSCYNCNTWEPICKSYSTAGCYGLDATKNYTLVKENGNNVTIRSSHNGNIISTFKAHTDKIVFPAVISTDEKSVFTGDNLSGNIIQWDLQTGKKIKTIYHFELSKEDLIRDIVCHPSGNSLIISTDRFNVYILNLKNHNLKLIGKHSRLISSISVCSQGCHVITSSTDQSAVIWDTQGKEIRRFNSLKGFSNADLSADHKYLLTVSEEEKDTSDDFEEDVKIWDVTTGKVKYTTKTFTDAVFSNGNRFLSNYDGDLWEFDIIPLAEVMNRVRNLIYDSSLTEDEKRLYYLK